MNKILIGKMYVKLNKSCLVILLLCLVAQSAGQGMARGERNRFKFEEKAQSNIVASNKTNSREHKGKSTMVLQVYALPAGRFFEFIDPGIKSKKLH